MAIQNGIKLPSNRSAYSIRPLQRCVVPHFNSRIAYRHTQRSLAGRGDGRCIIGTSRLGPIRAFNESNSFTEVKDIASQAKQRAEELLPALQQALSAANAAREPAAEAERRWQEAHNSTLSVQAESHTALEELRAGTTSALGGSEQLADSLLKHHVTDRLNSFISNLANNNENSSDTTADKQLFLPTEEKLSWLPGAISLTQVGGCTINGSPYVVACVAVAATPLEVDELRSIMLHWGPTRGASCPWMNAMPQGWHTSPSVSQPVGETAWETAFSSFAPILDGQQLTSSIEVFSVILQIPLDEAIGGVKFVLKRTDGGQPEWIKPWHNSDFYIDFGAVKEWFEWKRQQAQLLGMQAAAAAGNAALQELAASSSSSSSFSQQQQQAVDESIDDWAIGGDNCHSLDWDDSPSAAMSSSQEELPPVTFSFDEDDSPTIQQLPTVTAQDITDSTNSSDTPVVPKDTHNKQQQEIELVELMQWSPPDFTTSSNNNNNWLKRVERWEVVAEHPPQLRSLGQQLQHLKVVLKAAEEEDAKEDVKLQKTIQELLQRCYEVEDTLHKYDSAAFAARVAQQEKEKLWEAHAEASHEASHLQTEIEAALDTARRATVALKGRATEVVISDLAGLCYQLAAEDIGGKKNNGGGFWPFNNNNQPSRKMIFISQKEMPIAGYNANLVAHVYLEGPAAAVDALLAPKPQPTDSMGESFSEEESINSTGTTSTEERKASVSQQHQPTLDTIVVAIAAAEEFPDGKLTPPPLLHFGCVPHSGAKWQQAPAGWTSKPAALPENTAGIARQEDVMPWVPFQSYTLTSTDGSSPVLIDPEMLGLCVRLPLKDCVLGRMKGLEFVLKAREDRWLSHDKGHGTPVNFYVELPVPGR